MRAWERLPEKDRKKLAVRLLEDNEEEVKEFIDALEAAVLRQINLTLKFYPSTEHNGWSRLKRPFFIASYQEADATPKPVTKYEIQIRYDNGDEITGTFVKKEDA